VLEEDLRSYAAVLAVSLAVALGTAVVAALAGGVRPLAFAALGLGLLIAAVRGVAIAGVRPSRPFPPRRADAALTALFTLLLNARAIGWHVEGSYDLAFALALFIAGYGSTDAAVLAWQHRTTKGRNA
jgi:hypothetical protein